MSIEGSLDGSLFADVLKSESRLRLLKLDNAMILTPGHCRSPGTALILKSFVTCEHDQPYRASDFNASAR
jgi:hypothetical protein